ncbi:glutamate--cysteine ligase [Streptomyces sp. DT171]|uniref:glutamate--cysteine ligase n=1 Tax=Streptomyces sp. DT171 TaxID=3416524 RepID=UPI003CFAA46F
MGKEINQSEFEESDYSIFRERLTDCLTALEKVVDSPGFGRCETTVGAELEMFLMTDDGRPTALNEQVRRTVADDRVALEVDQFNLEVNLRPVPLRGRPFTAMRSETEELLSAVAAAAGAHGAAPVMIGTLPTLTRSDLGRPFLTADRRFRVLDHTLARLRATPYALVLPDDEHSTLIADSIAVQGANCSWQVHLLVRPDEFTRVYNAAQLAIAPVLAAAGNSSLPMGRRGWQEARIPMYEQGFGESGAGDPAGSRGRVAFGDGWLKGGAVQLFADAVHRHEVLLPVLSEQHPAQPLAPGEFPRLEELSLHQGTVWTWNRPVYDPSGHLRVEFRALPSGPTPADMTANSAFLLGLTLHLAARPEDLDAALPFEAVRENFYRAARLGLGAQLHWPGESRASPEQSPAPDLIRALLPAALDGLVSAGVDVAEAEESLGVIEDRVSTGQTGAVWQRRALNAYERHDDHESALRRLVLAYSELSVTRRPVHTWPVPAREKNR